MGVLIVVAHPDDEILGCGATASLLARSGVPVRTCILSGEVTARNGRPSLRDLHEDIRTAQEILGLGEPVLGCFPNLQFNTVPHIERVQFIEKAILDTGSDVVFTHHPSDVNDDHRHTAHACGAAVRLFQRRAGVKPLRALLYMEILSSTDWSFPGEGRPFQADTFVPATETLSRKIEALRAYRGVMRPFPHPRSEEILRGIAAYRGGQAGMEYAEAFQTAFRAYRSAEAFFELS
jgi:LmbE family N-acetylglucosaminyl deacetylase